MYDKDKCGKCKNRLKCLTGEQWICTEHQNDWIINPDYLKLDQTTTMNIEGDLVIKGKRLEDIIDERIKAKSFWRKAWRTLIGRNS